MQRVIAAVLLIVAAAPEATVASALELERQGDDRRALETLEALVKADPICELCRVEAARLRLKRGEGVEQAIFHADVARALAPENPRAHYVLALGEDEAGHREPALRALEVALALRPDYADARFRLAGLLSAAGRFPEAVTEWTRYLAQVPAAHGARLQLAQALSQSGNRKAAEVELRKLLKIDATRVVATRKLIELLEASGRAQDAAKLAQTLGGPGKTMRPLKPSAR